MLESSSGQECKEGPRPGALVTRFLSYATRKNLRAQTKQESVRACPALSGLVFLVVEGVPKLFSLPPGLGLFPMPPGREEAAQGPLSCLLALDCFSCWGFRLEITMERAE